ncbi:MAG: hypothetical protein IJ760_01745 [Bacteroidales bacterium]|nr:hypothetical protein [Bacteroidales bacterium]
MPYGTAFFLHTHLQSLAASGRHKRLKPSLQSHQGNVNTVCSSIVLRLFFDCSSIYNRRTIEEQSHINRRTGVANIDAARRKTARTQRCPRARFSAHDRRRRTKKTR